MLKVKNLALAYQQTPLITGFTLTLGSAGCYFLTGPSGCGKTTLLDLLSGRHPPRLIQRGTISWKYPIQCSYFEQTPHLFEQLDVKANLYVMLDPRSAIDLAELIEITGIAPLLSKMPSVLSAGEKARVALVRTLLRPADVYLLDEPFAFLNQDLATRIRTYLKKRSTNCLILVNSHVLVSGEDVIEVASNRAYEFNQGRESRCVINKAKPWTCLAQLMVKTLFKRMPLLSLMTFFNALGLTFLLLALLMQQSVSSALDFVSADSPQYALVTPQAATRGLTAAELESAMPLFGNQQVSQIRAFFAPLALFDGVNYLPLSPYLIPADLVEIEVEAGQVVVVTSNQTAALKAGVICYNKRLLTTDFTLKFMQASTTQSFLVVKETTSFIATLPSVVQAEMQTSLFTRHELDPYRLHQLNQKELIVTDSGVKDFKVITKQDQLIALDALKEKGLSPLPLAPYFIFDYQRLYLRCSDERVIPVTFTGDQVYAPGDVLNQGQIRIFPTDGTSAPVKAIRATSGEADVITMPLALAQELFFEAFAPAVVVIFKLDQIATLSTFDQYEINGVMLEVNRMLGELAATLSGLMLLMALIFFAHGLLIMLLVGRYLRRKEAANLALLRQLNFSPFKRLCYFQTRFLAVGILTFIPALAIIYLFKLYLPVQNGMELTLFDLVITINPFMAWQIGYKMWFLALALALIIPLATGLVNFVLRPRAE